ncbi:MAG: hypothetical protein HC916_15415 [Coleofasciculaceae cyanobacterium SM2_1_6]|nr:hypothetical protein [Coleofasciculaceae cyanobacterium SM2_1_6]
MSSENNSPNIALTITFTDPELTAEERDEEAVRLLQELQDNPDIESVDRVRDPNPPEGSMSLGGFLEGVVKAVINPENYKNVLSGLVSYLNKKQIVLEVEVDGSSKKLKVSVNNLEELEAAIKAATEVIEA